MPTVKRKVMTSPTNTLGDMEGDSRLRRTPLQPVEPRKLYLSAASQIAEAISRGRWNPGDKLPPERELAEMLHISRSSLRQALAALEAIAVIHRKAGVGTFVQDGALEAISQEIVSELVTKGDPLMLVEARWSLEPSVAQLAAKNRDSGDIAVLERALRLMDRFDNESTSPAEFIDADIEFHLSIANASHNPILIHLFEEIADQLRHRIWLIAALPVVAKRANQYQVHHYSIYEAIRNQQTVKAQHLMADHLQSIADNLRSISAIAEE